MRRRLVLLSVAALGLCLAALGYRAGLALASGIPTSNTLVFTGTLTNNGTAMTGNHTILLQPFISGSNTAACNSTTQTVPVNNGIFSVALDQSCVAGVKTYPNIVVQVTVDGTNLGGVALSATPYAVESAVATGLNLVGTTGLPANPAPGATVFNSTTLAIDIYSASGWQAAPLTGGSTPCFSGQGWADCSGVCTETALDPANCGSCGHACATNGVCVAGTCGCPNSETICGGTCINLQTSNSNCGFCGSSCPTGLNCGGGICCAPGLTGCKGLCTNVYADPTNCGGCGTVCQAAAPYCTNGVCGNIAYATGSLGGQGNKNIAFVFAPSGTQITSDAAYKAFCESMGFEQNQNSQCGMGGNMCSSTAYYCSQYCCFLGSGNSMWSRVTQFVNYGLPQGTPLQVFDRGCGDWCGGYNVSVNTTDKLNISGPNTATYTTNGSDYCRSKTATFSSDGVVVCQTL